MAQTEITVPDLGGMDEVEVIELCVKAGDSIGAEESLVVLESDKATMEVPAPNAGKLESFLVAVGDKVSSGSALAIMDTMQSAGEPQSKPENTSPPPVAAAPVPAPVASTQADSSPKTIDIMVPDLGGLEQVEVIELSAKAGDKLELEQTLIILESDKASMEVPVEQAGTLISFKVKIGDKVNEGDVMASMEVVAAQNSTVKSPAPQASPTPPAQVSATTEPQKKSPQQGSASASTGLAHAGPAVRKLARELGVDLSLVSGTGPRARITKEDLHGFIKQKVQSTSAAPLSIKGSDEDFSKHGDISLQALSKIKKVTAKNMLQSWTTIPQVTQFDEADITDLDEYRKNNMKGMTPDGVKVSPLAFILKACVKALQRFPQFNASLGPNGDNLILKHYYHVAVAVDTPDGLMVPVIKHAQEKGIIELAQQSSLLAQQARDKKLSMDAMMGASFTVSSLGGIGGTAFTPIVNGPQVAILGVSKAAYKPVWNGSSFEPRLILPLSVSYDHRVIDGAQAALFTRYLCELLSDVRHLLL